jgi:hypothetical protein
MKMFRAVILGMVFTTSRVGIAGASGQATQTTGIQAQPPSKTARASNGAAPADKTDASKPGDASANVQAAAGDQPASDKQKKLAADTDKLLAMATDLKQQVDKTNKDVLSVDVIKKAEEIEKLARSLKNEMKQ